MSVRCPYGGMPCCFDQRDHGHSVGCAPPRSLANPGAELGRSRNEDQS
jgi:hypothetical protein